MRHTLTHKSQANKYYPHKANRSFWRIVFIVIIGMLFYFHSVAQAKDSLIADETTMQVIKEMVHIKTSNEPIKDNLELWKYRKFHCFNENLKKDKNGDYNFWFRKKDLEELYKWIAKL